MKHYLLSVANGLHTPPCNNSHGKSSHFFNFRFSLFTPLLVLFLLIVGNSPAWGGWRFQGQNGTDENWVREDNMTQVGSSDIWYYKISNLNNDIQFKINNGNWEGEKQKYWSANHDDQNRGNVQLEDAKDGDIEGKNRFKYSRNTNFGKDVARDLYIFVKGDANNPSTNDRVWAIAVTPGSGAISEAYSLRGDLWLDADGGWASKNNQRNPVFVNMTNDVAAQLSYLIPIPSGSNAMKSRFTLISATSPTNENKLETSTSTSSLGDGNYSSDSENGGKYKLTISANGGSYPTVKRIVLDYYASGKLRARLEDYIVKRDGWHLYIDDKYMGAMSNSGSFTVEGLASGTHTMYIANYSHNSINSSAYDPYSDNGGKIHAQQWFGGLFIDMNPAHSNVTFEDKKAYYNSGDNYFGPQTYPIADTKNARGKFKINEKSDVEFTFDGGVITINAVDHATPAVPDYQPWSGDSYKDWYLTGDFTNPNVFDAWVQNPSGYKFTTNGDNYQTVSITLDPNDASIFYNHEGHKLTRFEIIRQGTWDDPRINKPNFDASTSNCELKTDWKDAGSDRMSLELTAKSVIKFDIWRWGTTSGSADRKVTITITPVPQVTVTFLANGETFATQVFDKGGKATIPVGAPVRDGYTFNGWDWDFNSAVNSNITLNAVWAYKGIESISLNESEHMTWVGNSDFTLTPTYSPSDVITKAVTWSSNNESVATVDNGIVHAVGAGTATITCTVTDQYDTKKTATCEVTVAACEMTTSDLYTMTVTGYNTYSGDEAILTNLWNESAENDGPAGMTITRFAFKKKDAGTILYAYDDNGTVKVKEDASGDDVQWLLIPTGETYTPSWNNGNSCQLYYIKNKATGAYMHRGSVGVNTGNPDWFYSVTNTNATNTANDDYKWFFVYENENQRCIFVKSGVGGEKKSSYKLHTSNQYNSETNTHAAKPMLPVGRTADINAYAKSYNNTNDFNYNTDPNPNYLASQMNTSYYRMNTDATVKANLGNVLVKGDVITVRLYADAVTSVKLTNADDTEVNTIPLAADTEFEYSYTVYNASPLLGESVFIIKATDNHAGIASIEVTRTLVANPSNPELSWETDLSGGVTQSALGSTFQHIASSTLSLGAIHYVSSNEAVATVAEDGTVTPHSAGTTTITATIEAEGCYDEASISYNITLTEASLQEAIDATPVGETLTLTHDYDENAVINKAITLDAQGYTIDDLTVEYEGDLTLSSELTVRDFTIWAKAGNTSIPAASGQVRNASKLNVNGNAYFLYTVDPSGEVQYGWYDFTVPFPINIVSGIKGIQEGVLKEDFRNGVDYAVMEYFGEKQAQGQYPYKKFSGVMQPKKLYTITLSNYNTLRMQKTADGALVASDEVTLNAYAGDDINKNWNGVGNGTLHHADADNLSAGYVQVYQSGSKTFLPVIKNDYSFVVGTAFMVQETGTMTLSQATHGALLAPSRYESAPATAIQIASEGKPFSDQLFITASETGGQAYTPGVDVAKAGELGSANVPQIWTNAYNSSLCVHEAQLINGKAQYKLSIYAPVAGSYTLTSKNIPADYSLYLTQNGMIVSELSDTYTLDLSKGITTEYGLLLTEIYNSPTGIENTQTDKIQTTKIIRNGVLYILHNGKVYNAQGAKVK